MQYSQEKHVYDVVPVIVIIMCCYEKNIEALT